MSFGWGRAAAEPWLPVWVKECPRPAQCNSGPRMQDSIGLLVGLAIVCVWHLLRLD